MSSCGPFIISFNVEIDGNSLRNVKRKGENTTGDIDIKITNSRNETREIHLHARIGYHNSFSKSKLLEDTTVICKEGEKIIPLKFDSIIKHGSVIRVMQIDHFDNTFDCVAEIYMNYKRDKLITSQNYDYEEISEVPHIIKIDRGDHSYDRIDNNKVSGELCYRIDSKVSGKDLRVEFRLGNGENFNNTQILRTKQLSSEKYLSDSFEFEYDVLPDTTIWIVAYDGNVRYEDHVYVYVRIRSDRKEIEYESEEQHYHRIHNFIYSVEYFR